jgi:hypothetical protein
MAKRGIPWRVRSLMTNQLVTHLRRPYPSSTLLKEGRKENDLMSKNATDARPFLAGPPFDVSAGSPEHWESYSQSRFTELKIHLSAQAHSDSHSRPN